MTTPPRRDVAQINHSTLGSLHGSLPRHTPSPCHIYCTHLTSHESPHIASVSSATTRDALMYSMCIQCVHTVCAMVCAHHSVKDGEEEIHHTAQNAAGRVPTLPMRLDCRQGCALRSVPFSGAAASFGLHHRSRCIIRSPPCQGMASPLTHSIPCERGRNASSVAACGRGCGSLLGPLCSASTAQAECAPYERAPVRLPLFQR